MSSKPLARGTLGRRLVASVTILVAALTLAISAATVLATSRLFAQQVDRQLDQITDRLRGPGLGPGDRLLGPGQPIDTIAIYLPEAGQPVGGRLTETLPRNRQFAVRPIPTETVRQLADLPVNGRKHTERLGPLGRYRLVALSAGTGTLIIGIPLRQTDEGIVAMMTFAAVLSAAVIVATVFASRALVIRSLRPLYRVAATATQVSQLPLDRGEVALAVRVPAADADPVSEAGRVGQALNHLLNNVEEALAARQASETKVRQFVADASHELRNPLAAIRGYAELTRRDRDQMPEPAAYAMARVESEAERMSHLVDDLLLLARLDSGPDLDLQPVDLTEVVINAVNDARVAGPDHVWQLALPEEPVVALADRHRLHQVVANLLANARAHTPAGTHVQASVTLDGPAAVLQITDDGPGVPPDLQPHIFERFTRAETSRVRAAQGASTGLGLAIVAAIVEAHRGTVQVSSLPGRTEFVVHLPLV